MYEPAPRINDHVLYAEEALQLGNPHAHRKNSEGAAGVYVLHSLLMPPGACALPGPCGGERVVVIRFLQMKGDAQSHGGATGDPEHYMMAKMWTHLGFVRTVFRLRGEENGICV